MKKLSLLALLTATLLITLTQANAHVKESKPAPKVATRSGKGLRSVTLSIPSMHCAGCAIGVQTALKKVSGVQSVVVDPDTKHAKVTYLSAKVAPKTFMNSLTKAGWKSTLILEKTANTNNRTTKTETDRSCPDCP